MPCNFSKLQKQNKTTLAQQNLKENIIFIKRIHTKYSIKQNASTEQHFGYWHLQQKSTQSKLKLIKHFQTPSAIKKNQPILIIKQASWTITLLASSKLCNNFSKLQKQKNNYGRPKTSKRTSFSSEKTDWSMKSQE